MRVHADPAHIQTLVQLSVDFLQVTLNAGVKQQGYATDTIFRAMLVPYLKASRDGCLPAAIAHQACGRVRNTNSPMSAEASPSQTHSAGQQCTCMCASLQ